MADRTGQGEGVRTQKMDPISQMFESNRKDASLLTRFITDHLTLKEATQIWSQFQIICIPNRQVLWTGMVRESVQRWADAHGMQTLTTAMGPYMDCENSLCPRKIKSATRWTEYIHGASAIFALYISKGEYVTLLCSPPPQRFHPTGNTSFQCIEAPIITGELGNRAVQRIEMIHPFSADAAQFSYQFWPEDHVKTWICHFEGLQRSIAWRKVKKDPPAWSLSKVKNGKWCGQVKELQHTCLPKKDEFPEFKQAHVFDKQIIGVSKLDVLRSRHAEEHKNLEDKAVSLKERLSLQSRREQQSLQRQESRQLQISGKRKKKTTRKEFKKIRKELEMKHSQEIAKVEQDMAKKRKRLGTKQKKEVKRQRKAEAAEAAEVKLRSSTSNIVPNEQQPKDLKVFRNLLRKLVTRFWSVFRSLGRIWPNKLSLCAKTAFCFHAH